MLHRGQVHVDGVLARDRHKANAMRSEAGIQPPLVRESCGLSIVTNQAIRSGFAEKITDAPSLT
jgi:hypothetical protein